MCRRNVCGKTLELLLEIDEPSASFITAQRFMLNFSFGKARMRQVNRNPTNTGLGYSAARSGTAHMEHLSGGIPQPPAPGNSVEVREVQQKSRKSTKQQPPSNGKSTAQKTPKHAGLNSVTCRLKLAKPVGRNNQAPQLSGNAAGSRLPIMDPSTDQLQDGIPSHK